MLCSLIMEDETLLFNPHAIEGNLNFINFILK